MSDTSAPAADDRIDQLPTNAAGSLAPDTGVTPATGDRAVRWASWAFVAYLAVSLPLLMWLGSYRWFFGDEWSFLADRSVTVDGLFAPHNQQHWVSFPVLVYRGLYSLVGLRAYWPYQLVVVVLHLATAALLRVIMRRAGVHPWIATLAAGSFVLLGAAEDNILWAFQITFVGSLVAGLGQIVLADHDGPIDRRDWFGLGAGLLALMTSGQAPSLIIGTGIVCLLRRRWWPAAFHTVPLGALYLVWVQLEDVSTMYRVEGYPFTFSAYVTWMREAALGLFTAVGHWGVLGAVLAVVLVCGTVLAWRSEGTASFVGRAGVPLVLVVVCLLSMSTAAPSRFFLGDDASRAGRYIGVMAALTLPLLAVAADALARRWPRALPAVCALLLLPIPFNATQFGTDGLLTDEYFQAARRYVSGLADLPIAAAVPDWVEPNDQIVGQPDMTIGWLRGAESEGTLPDEEPLDILQRAMAPLHLGVAIDPRPLPTGLRCEVHDEPIPIDPALGEHWVIRTPIRVALRQGDGATTPWRSLGPPSSLATPEDTHVSITLPDLRLLVGPSDGASAFELCR